MLLRVAALSWTALATVLRLTLLPTLRHCQCQVTYLLQQQDQDTGFCALCHCVQDCPGHGASLHAAAYLEALPMSGHVSAAAAGEGQLPVVVPSAIVCRTALAIALRLTPLLTSGLREACQCQVTYLLQRTTSCCACCCCVQDCPGHGASLDPAEYLEALVTYMLQQQEKDYMRLHGSVGGLKALSK
jgi:hypothetical protein